MRFVGGSVRLFKIWGIQIELNVSWFFVFALVSFGLSAQYFPAQLPGRQPAVYIFLGVVTAILFFASILLHELSHSRVALRQGIPIQRISLFLLGGVSQMTREPRGPGDEFRMAIAGPLSSLAISAGFALVYFLSLALPAGEELGLVSQYLSIINAALAVFNLVPGFPLDGGRVLRAAIWGWTGSLERATAIAARSGQVVAYLLIFVGLLWIARGQLTPGLWFVLIGWFLEQAALSSYQTAHLQALSDISVGDVMTERVRTVRPDLSLKELVDGHLLQYQIGRFPVVDGERLLGVITLRDIRSVPKPEWDKRSVGEALQPLGEHLTIEPEASVADAMMQMAQEDIGQLLVCRNSHLLGLITKTDVLRILRFRRELGV